ncbi:MAG: HD domain-containing protein, partial [Roseiflexaceae bacterium]|nr:HD domain-containing protein [Roseiflexaceae bacterium]
LRAMQFAARFDMQLAPETAARCRLLLPMAPSIAPERMWGEWAKWAQAAHPRSGLIALAESGWLAHFPELAALRGCLQSPTHHPEGDVWTHTGHVVQAAARIAGQQRLAAEAWRTLLFAALCHDLGKPATTTIEGDNRIRSAGHAQAGIAPTKALLTRIGAPQGLIEQVLPLVREHMAHYGQPTARTLRRLAARLVPSTIATWALLVEADHSGRPPHPPRAPARDFVTHARALDLLDGPPKPILSGRDLLAAGYQQGPTLGLVLRDAYQAQLDGAFATAEEGMDWLRRTTTRR